MARVSNTKVLHDRLMVIKSVLIAHGQRVDIPSFNKGLTAMEIANLCDIPRPTIYRILKDTPGLEVDYGIVRIDGTFPYKFKYDDRMTKKVDEIRDTADKAITAKVREVASRQKEYTWWERQIIENIRTANIGKTPEEIEANYTNAKDVAVYSDYKALMDTFIEEQNGERMHLILSLALTTPPELLFGRD